MIEVSKLLESIQSDSDHLRNWRTVRDILSRKIALETQNSSALLRQVIDEVFTSKFLCEVWIGISGVYRSSEIQGLQETREMFLCYQLLSNYFGLSRDFTLTKDRCFDALLRSLIEAIGPQHFDLQKCIVHIVRAMPTDVYTKFLVLVLEKKRIEVVFHDIPSSWALKSLQCLGARSRYLDFDLVDKDYFSSAIDFFFTRSRRDLDVTLIIDELTLIHPANHIFAIGFLKCFDDSYIPLLIDRVVKLWGNKYFIAQGNEKMQIYLSYLLFLLLNRITDQSILTSRRNGNTAPIIALSSGVSAYFDTTDRNGRQRAILIAKLFSKIMGNELKFNEIDSSIDPSTLSQDEAVEVFGMRQLSINTKSAVMSSAHGAISKQQQQQSEFETSDQKSIHGQRLHESSSDDGSDDSLEPYYIVEENSSSNHGNKYNTVYLRKCLELLQTPSTQEEAYDKQRAALMNIPSIVASNPADGPDVCGPLIRELLRLENSFNMKDFTELQSTAIQALLCKYPDRSAPVMTLSLSSEAAPIGSRLIVISELIKSAHTLSGIDIRDTLDNGLYHKNKDSLQSTLREMTTKLQNMKLSSLTSDHSGGTSTKIKRPTKYLQYLNRQNDNKTKYFRNLFGPVSAIYFYNILQVISSIANVPDRVNSDNQAMGIPDKIDISDKIISIASPSFKELPISQKGISSSRIQIFRSIEDDDMNSLMIAQSLLALGAFVRCSINTTFQRSYTIQTLLVAKVFRNTLSLSIRRASLSAVLACIESWLILNNNLDSLEMKKSDSHSNNDMTALDTLLNITNLGVINHPATSSSSSSVPTQDIELLGAGTDAVDWIMSSLSDDADTHSRILKMEIMRIAFIILND